MLKRVSVWRVKLCLTFKNPLGFQQLRANNRKKNKAVVLTHIFTFFAQFVDNQLKHICTKTCTYENACTPREKSFTDTFKTEWHISYSITAERLDLLPLCQSRHQPSVSQQQGHDWCVVWQHQTVFALSLLLSVKMSVNTFETCIKADMFI